MSEAEDQSEGDVARAIERLRGFVYPREMKDALETVLTDHASLSQRAENAESMAETYRSQFDHSEAMHQQVARERARLRGLIEDVADRLSHAESVDPNELTAALNPTPPTSTEEEGK